MQPTVYYGAIFGLVFLRFLIANLTARAGAGLRD